MNLKSNNTTEYFKEIDKCNENSFGLFDSGLNQFIKTSMITLKVYFDDLKNYSLELLKINNFNDLKIKQMLNYEKFHRLEIGFNKILFEYILMINDLEEKVWKIFTDKLNSNFDMLFLFVIEIGRLILTFLV